MEVKSANPFLFTDDDYTSPSAPASNPFLMGGDDFTDNSSSNDNPFLSQTATTMAPAAGGTNPFAFDPMDDMGPAEAAPASFNVITTTMQNTFMTNTFIDNTSMYQPQQQPEVNFFTEPANTTPDFFSANQPTQQHQDFFMDQSNMSAPLPQKPTDLDLRYTHTVARVEEGFDGEDRQPPPRPPPSKETQDLLMTVMGAMDATSSHLLDRIPLTRTPSPVSMRDLHSPSPTPDPQYADLLDVSDVKSNVATNEGHSDMNLMDDLMGDSCDINKNHQDPQIMGDMSNVEAMVPMSSMMPNVVPMIPTSNAQSIFNIQPEPEIVSTASAPINYTTPVVPIISTVTNTQTIVNTTTVTSVTPVPIVVPEPVVHKPSVPPPIPTSAPNKVPPRPGPPVRPPRPTPPQKPPPPVIPQAPPQKPPPPTVKPTLPPEPPKPVIPVAPVEEPVDEMMEMFGSQQTNAKTTADIMNLYKKQEAPVDLLCDNMDAVPSSTEAVDGSGSESRKSSVPSTDNITVTNSVNNEMNVTSNTDTISSPSPAVQDNFLSPEPSQADLQMDTSDSQSKGSVSSVTINPFAANDDFTSPVVQEIHNTETETVTLDNNVFQEDLQSNVYEPTPNIFGVEPTPPQTTNIFASESVISNEDSLPPLPETKPKSALDQRFGFTANKADSFDAFTAKFESAKDENKNGAFESPFSGGNTAWGNSGFDGGNQFTDVGNNFTDAAGGFGAEDNFDTFLALQEPPAVPQSTPNRLNQAGSVDSDEDRDFSVVIKPKMATDGFGEGALPILAPPPVPVQSAFSDTSPRMNPFDQSGFAEPAIQYPEALPLSTEMKRSESQESPGTPLFDEDVSQPLEPFPRLQFAGEGWEMHLRQPNKKKITGQRFWKKIFVRLQYQSDCVLLQLFNQESDKDPFQELPLQPCYSVSEISAQQYDNYGKIFTVKLQYIFYKERPGVRPGQVKKAERITNKLSQFAAYAIQGDYQGVKEFGSDLKKLGLPVEHAPQVSQLMKIGSLNYEDLKQFSVSIEEALFKIQAHRDRALHYKMEEVQVTCVDELYVHQDCEGHIEKQIARVRLFFLGFLTGMPDIELGVNDMRRQGKEVVGRHDIIPVVTEEWIRLEDVEFHNCVQQDEYNDTHIIKFKPPDACYIELLRFRVRPPKNRELPLQLKATMCITGTKVELRADVLVPGFASRKLGQVPCEDVMIRFPIPEVWIYLFRVEKHFRYGSVKSAHRRTGKIKGIERILGTVDTLQESLIEVTSGQAKYEHQHRAIVWRCPRLPKEGQGAYTTHNMVCRLALTSYDQIPDQLAEYCYVEFTMPATQASHTTVRSVSIQNSDSDEPPEKFVRHLARHEYRVGIEHTEAEGPAAYLAATMTKPKPPPEEKPKPIPEVSSSDSD